MCMCPPARAAQSALCACTVGRPGAFFLDGGLAKAPAPCDPDFALRDRWTCERDRASACRREGAAQCKTAMTTTCRSPRASLSSPDPL